jgi:hypothetical protein
MAGDAVYNAKVALLAIFQAKTTANGWTGNQPEIRWGQPTEPEDYAFLGEVIFFGETRERAEFPGMGPRRDETFNLRFIIDIRAEGDDEPTVELRVRTLKNEAFETILDNMTLSGTINRVTGWEANVIPVPEPAAWRAQAVCDQNAVAAPNYPH